MGYDLVVRNGTVVDGTRAARYRADVAVTGDRISALGAVAEKGTTEIDASGLVVAPGFIDAHTHDDRLMLSAPEMAPKVSQGVTTVVAGNCGISLAPAPRGMRLPVLPPIDLLDDAGGWFRFRTFGSYVKELNASPAATNCALLVGPHHAAGADDGRSPKTCNGKRSRGNAQAGGGGACVRCHRRLDRAVLRAGARRDDRGSDPGLPPARGTRRNLLHAHARRRRPGDRLAGRELSHRPRARRAGGDLAPQGGGHAEPRPLGGNPAVHRARDALAEDRARLLSLLRVVDDPFLQPHAYRLDDAGHLVQAASRVRRLQAGRGRRKDGARDRTGRAAAAAGRRDLLLH